MPYPLKPIVSSNPLLPALYDDHPGSIALISACLTPPALADLLERGATFDTVLFINDDGLALQDRLRPAGGDDDALYPCVESLTLDQFDAQAISLIHAAFGNRRSHGFFTMGG